MADASTEAIEGRLLDGFLLLAAGGSSLPEDVVRVNLSSLQIVDVAAEDLSYFCSLDSLDVSDNHLGYEQVLEQFARIPRLSRLMIACNSIAALQIPLGTLQHLRYLDLSFNELHGEVLAQLARLPRLEKLNLSSNCISSVPPEEDLYGMHVLEELNLDANDLVQFDQWRALDALPRLRTLSLASNRIKRLKDDSTGTMDSCSYFPSLEVLNLSSNEITDCSCLPVVRLFQALKEVHLTDNPCCRGPKPVPLRIPGTKVIAHPPRPTTGSATKGCFQKPVPAKQPRLKLDANKLKSVAPYPPLLRPGRDGRLKKAESRRPPQVGVLAKSGQLIVDVTSRELPRIRTPSSGDGAGADEGDGFFITSGSGAERPKVRPEREASRQVEARREAVQAAQADGDDTYEDYDEEELDRVLRQRRERIEECFQKPVQEPASFMRSIPFAVTAAAGARLGFRGSSDVNEELEESRIRSSSVVSTGVENQASAEPTPAERRARRERDGGALRHGGSLLLPKIGQGEKDVATQEPLLLPQLPGSGPSGAEMLSVRPARPAQKSVPTVDVMDAFKAIRAVLMSDFGGSGTDS